MSEDKIIEEIREKYGSVSKMISLVENKISHLIKYGGQNGRDNGDTAEEALRIIPRKYHALYYQYAHTFPRP